MHKKIYLMSIRGIPVTFHISLIPALLLITLLIGWIWYPSTFLTLTLGKQVVLMTSGVLVLALAVVAFEGGRLAVTKLDRGSISEITLFPVSARLALSESQSEDSSFSSVGLKGSLTGGGLVLLLAAIFGGLSLLPSAGQIQQIAMQEAALVMGAMGLGRIVGVFALDRQNALFALVERMSGRPGTADLIWRIWTEGSLTVLILITVWQLLVGHWLIAALLFVLAWALREATARPYRPTPYRIYY